MSFDSGIVRYVQMVTSLIEGWSPFARSERYRSRSSFLPRLCDGSHPLRAGSGGCRQRRRWLCPRFLTFPSRLR